MVVALIPAVVISNVAKVEEVEEIAERRAVERHVGIIVVNDGVREIVTACDCVNGFKFNFVR